MAWPNPSYYLASKAKRPNLYYLATSVILCSIFYIAGIWQHTRGGIANLAESECTQLQNISGVAPKSHTLDFDTHHSAIDLPIAPTSPARVNHFPACPTHCPEPNEVLKCRVPAPNGYTTPFRWPESRDSVWFANVPHKELTVEKAVQNWVRFEGKRFRFPGGGDHVPSWC
ncbi:putative methyltransferase PMT15 [Vitis vinifera]|uniref:Methyltransferase n=1 Tax=Vitis vinifera TaxID=29760 RepID=A0A438DB21_VITVI|nr:putative methyltransferase PMT15 [Vitis vinifera]